MHSFISNKKLGFISAMLIAVVTAITFGIALLTPPISGPLAASPIQYPFTDIVSRFPRDYLWMYPAMLLMLLFIILQVCIYYDTSDSNKTLAHISLIFAVTSGMVLFSDYFIQISIVQPSLLNGETEGMSLLTQYNPHGLFVVLEEIGYLMMSLSFLFTALVFSEKTKLDTVLRRVLLAAFFLSLSALILISIIYGIHREYLLEVALISIDFPALIVFGILLSIRFRK